MSTVLKMAISLILLLVSQFAFAGSWSISGTPFATRQWTLSIMDDEGNPVTNLVDKNFYFQAVDPLGGKFDTYIPVKTAKHIGNGVYYISLDEYTGNWDITRLPRLITIKKMERRLKSSELGQHPVFELVIVVKAQMVSVPAAGA